ncbi:MAG: hypothetical protein ACKVVP_08610 [Chloroflexota bacterium]
MIASTEISTDGTSVKGSISIKSTAFTMDALLDHLATTVSAVFAPPLLTLSLIWLAADRVQGVPSAGRSIAALIIGLSVLPALFIYLAYRLGYIHDIKLSRRSDRMGPALFATACALAIQPVLAFLDGPPTFAGLASALTVQLAVLALVTNWWRISYHTASIGSLAMAGLALQGPSLAIPLMVVAALVAWSRLRLHCHSPSQVVAGLATAVPLLWCSWPI